MLLALIAAETAMALSLIIGSRGLSGRLSVRNNVSNYSTYLYKKVVKVGDFVIIKEEYILYKGNPFEHVFIFLSINVSST